MDKIIEFFKMVASYVVEYSKIAIAFVKEKAYSPLVGYWNKLFTDVFKMSEAPLRLWQAMLILLGVIVLLLIIGAITKKTKIVFHVGKKKKVVKCKYKKLIKFPKLDVQDKVLEGWYKDEKFTDKYESIYLDTKKKLHLYANLVDEIEVVEEEPEVEVPVEEPVVEVVTEPIVTNEPIVEVVEEVEEVGVVEEALGELPVIMSVAEIYDELRYALLSYERTRAFSKVGAIRKQFIAEMFEKAGKVYLYLAIDPEAMQVKGYNVEKYSEPEFAVVPCKKTVANAEDFEEAIKLIEETMNFNNLVKAQVVVSKKVVSDEQARKSGFAFFVKNEVVATSADEYYKLLRASTNCYSVSPTAKNLKQVSNKMILKIFKKEDLVYLYLALDAEKEGLEFVGYDVNFVDTPSMFVVKTAEDFFKANVLIDKLMKAFEMEKHPEKAELNLDEETQRNCGFGYRIRF
ncbi:MAG: hypothetical protein J6R88_04765 [Clostridia bacterium]|nr:hypothetical protein [Clostridia bacterium]